MKLQKTSHPTPHGYRRLQIGEVVQPTDIMNAVYNEAAFTAPGRHGFISAAFLKGGIVDGQFTVAIYRKNALGIWQRIRNFFRDL